MTEEIVQEQQRTVVPIKLSEPEIVGGEWPSGFDKLNRTQEIENLSPVLLNAKSPLVFALDAPWGGGKTTFIKLWQQYLTHESQQRVCLYLNAWESDFSDDPLIPLLSTLDGWLSQLNGGENEAWKKTKALAPKILKGLTVASVKLGTMGVLDASDAIEGVAAEAAAGVTGDIVESFNSKLSALDEFKKLLQEALNELPEDQENLIIFVDELDRCRPTYAIEVLERIKHLFDIERIVFVLAVNSEQLSKSLQGVYGPNFDGLHYLKRFVDLDYKLAIPEIEHYVNALLSLEDIVSNFSQRPDGNVIHNQLKKAISWFAKKFSYQLRDIDQLIARFRLIIRSIPPNRSMDAMVLLALYILRQQNESLYQRFVSDMYIADEVVSFLVGNALESESTPREIAIIGGRLLSFLRDDDRGSEAYDQAMTPWKNRIEQLDPMDNKKRLFDLLVNVSTRGDSWENSADIQNAFQRIELVSQIDVSV